MTASRSPGLTARGPAIDRMQAAAVALAAADDALELAVQLAGELPAPSMDQLRQDLGTVGAGGGG